MNVKYGVCFQPKRRDNIELVYMIEHFVRNVVALPTLQNARCSNDGLTCRTLILGRKSLLIM